MSVPRPGSQTQSDTGVCLFKSTQMTLKRRSGWRQEARCWRLLDQGLTKLLVGVESWGGFRLGFFKLPFC